jgi:hypothetical protein
MMYRLLSRMKGIDQSEKEVKSQKHQWNSVMPMCLFRVYYCLVSPIELGVFPFFLGCCLDPWNILDNSVLSKVYCVPVYGEIFFFF